MSAPLLSLAGVSRRHGASVVLDDVHLDIAPEEFVILIGGSGSGKTTLLRTVAGLDRADAGRLTLRGTVIDDPAAAIFVAPERRRLGMVFQDYALWPHMTCLENVEAALPGRDHRRRARDLLDELGVGTFVGRKPAELSGGQQQRVGLARALATAPDLLLLDEPLSSLDVDVRDRMRERIRASTRHHGTAALFVTHDPTDAWRLADRIAVLERGRIVQASTPEDLYRRPATPRAARFTEAMGGFAIRELRRDGADAGFVWGGEVQRAAVVDHGDGHAALRAYVRPCGVVSGGRGEPATLVQAVFEAGHWRATWHVASHGWSLTSLESQPPPGETRLSLIADHVFLYSEGS